MVMLIIVVWMLYKKPSIVFIAPNNDYYTGSLFVIDANGTNLTQLIERTDMLLHVQRPAWSPDGRRLAFVAQVRKGEFLSKEHIYTMNADGSNITQVTSTGAIYRDLSWSPDGENLLFSGGFLGNPPTPIFKIYTIGVDGSSLVQLTFYTDDTGHAFPWLGSVDLSPIWSPDGKQIAFVSNRNSITGNEYFIFLMNSDGSNVTQLTNSNSVNVWYETPAWSPDGNHIAFSYSTLENDADDGIYIMDDTGSNSVQISTNPYDSSPAWSPDGGQIAFISRRDSPISYLFVMNTDGSNEVQVTNINSFYPVWQP